MLFACFPWQALFGIVQGDPARTTVESLIVINKLYTLCMMSLLALNIVQVAYMLALDLFFLLNMVAFQCNLPVCSHCCYS